MLGLFVLFESVSASPFRISKPISGILSNSRIRTLALRGGAEPGDEPKMYPPLSEEEMLSKLNTIPVFGVTDSKGNSVVFTDTSGSGKMVNYLFLQRDLATQVAASFEAQGKEDASSPASGLGELKVNDVPLGLVWKSLSRPVDSDSSVELELRLLADPTDLAIARNISSSLQAEGSEGEEAAKKKMERLSQDWGSVPVFTMAGIKIRAPGEDGVPVELQPWFLSISACISSYKKVRVDRTVLSEVKLLSKLSSFLF
jgi:hypothetical protein